MKPTVLVIEDHPVHMELLVDTLELMGCSIDQATDAPAGIDLARAKKPALILMDIRLTGMDGLTATRLLKQDPATQAIPIMAVTAHAMKGDRERALAAGCDEYITKPIDIPEFRAKVQRLVQRAASQNSS